MRTDALVALLARGAGPAPRAPVARRLLPAALAGLALAAAAALLLIGPVPRELVAVPAWWAKLGYALALALAAGWLITRLARPAADARRAWRTLALVVGGMAAFALLSLWRAPARMDALLGESWLLCPWTVLLLSAPALAAVLWALRALAPTHARRAGFAAGLLAGALGALGYALACPELSPAFVAAWYSLGMLLSGALGAWLGPRVLRW